MSIACLLMAYLLKRLAIDLFLKKKFVNFKYLAEITTFFVSNKAILALLFF